MHGAASTRTYSAGTRHGRAGGSGHARARTLKDWPATLHTAWTTGNRRRRCVRRARAGLRQNHTAGRRRWRSRRSSRGLNHRGFSFSSRCLHRDGSRSWLFGRRRSRSSNGRNRRSCRNCSWLHCRRSCNWCCGSWCSRNRSCNHRLCCDWRSRSWRNRRRSCSHDSDRRLGGNCRRSRNRRRDHSRCSTRLGHNLAWHICRWRWRSGGLSGSGCNRRSRCCLRRCCGCDHRVWPSLDRPGRRNSARSFLRRLPLLNRLQNIARLGDARPVDDRLGLRRRSLRSGRSGTRALVEILADALRLIFFQRAGVRLPLGHADFRQRVENLPALYFEFACQIIDSNFAHPSLLPSLRISAVHISLTKWVLPSCFHPAKLARLLFVPAGHVVRHVFGSCVLNVCRQLLDRLVPRLGYLDRFVFVGVGVSARFGFIP